MEFALNQISGISSQWNTLISELGNFTILGVHAVLIDRGTGMIYDTD